MKQQTPRQGVSFGKCRRCTVPALVKYNGEPLCLDCWDAEMRAMREVFDVLGLGKPANA